MDHEDIMHSKRIEAIFDKLDEIQDDKKKLAHLRQCHQVIFDRLDELTAYGDKLVADSTEYSKELPFIKTQEELDIFLAKMQDYSNKLKETQSVMAKIREYMEGMNAQVNAIGAKY